MGRQPNKITLGIMYRISISKHSTVFKRCGSVKLQTRHVQVSNIEHFEDI